MSSSAILNADMTTVGHTLRAGLRWWIAELAALVPERLRRPGRPSRPVALYTGATPLVMLGEDGPSEWRPGRSGRPVDLMVEGSLALVRELRMVRIGAAEVRQMAVLEADRLLPLPASQLHVDAEIAEAAPGDTMIVRVAGLPRTVAEDALAAASAARVTPIRLGIAITPDSGALAFDFAPALRASGRLPPLSRAPLLWWTVVAALVVLNVVLLVARDRQHVERLDALVAAQAPGVAIGRSMLHRIAGVEALSQATLARRHQLDPIADVAAATHALTDDAWVQRLTWDGTSMELAGYQQPSVDVLAELRGAHRFANARLTTSDVSAAALAGQPFDVTVDLRGDRR